MPQPEKDEIGERIKKLEGKEWAKRLPKRPSTSVERIILASVIGGVVILALAVANRFSPESTPKGTPLGSVVKKYDCRVTTGSYVFDSRDLTYAASKATSTGANLDTLPEFSGRYAFYPTGLFAPVATCQVGVCELVLPAQPARYIVETALNCAEEPAATQRSSGAVFQVEAYLDKNLRDPGSRQSIEWSRLYPLPDGKYYVRHKYRAKNGFGAMVIEDRSFAITRYSVSEVSADEMTMMVAVQGEYYRKMIDRGKKEAASAPLTESEKEAMARIEARSREAENAR